MASLLTAAVIVAAITTVLLLGAACRVMRLPLAIDNDVYERQPGPPRVGRPLLISPEQRFAGRPLASLLNATAPDADTGCTGQRIIAGLPLVAPGHQVCCDVVKPARMGTAVVKAPNPGRPHTACLPSFIIAGCQKSGTTALAAMLDEHPSIGMSVVKEVHFFDMLQARERSTDEYAAFFPDLPGDGAATPFISGEATPFYMASPHACREIARRLPTVRLIVLVRNPVERVWSEFQMKRRRVADQDALLALIEAQTAATRRCFELRRPDNAATAAAAQTVSSAADQFTARSAAVVACLSAEVGPNPKWEQFAVPLEKTFWDKERKAGAAGRAALLDRCFWPRPLRRNNGGRDSSGGGRARYSGGGGGRDGGGGSGGHGGDGGSGGSAGGGFGQRKMLHGAGDTGAARKACDKGECIATEGDQYWGSRGAGTGSMGDALLDAKAEAGLGASAEVGDGGRQVDYTFQLSCFLRRESLPHLRPAMRREARDLTRCHQAALRRRGSRNSSSITAAAGTGDGSGSSDHGNGSGGGRGGSGGKNGRSSVGDGSRGSGSSGGGGEDGADDAAVLDRMLELLPDCIGEVHKGISQQFLYRSMYALQLQQCTRYIPEERIMVIHTADLKERPEEVLRSIHAFIGVGDANYKFLQEEPSHHLHDLVASKFPTFENKTGWRLQTAPANMPTELEAELYAFFEPHNKMLFRMLGRQFPGWLR